MSLIVGNASYNASLWYPQCAISNVANHRKLAAKLESEPEAFYALIEPYNSKAWFPRWYSVVKRVLKFEV